MVNAEVILWGERVGAIAWDERRNMAVFRYDEDFATEGIELSPLMMPVVKNKIYEFPELRSNTFNGLPGLFADALPDAFGRALLDKWLVSVGKSFANPIERLCYQGKRGMGALEFVPAYADYLEHSDKLEMESLIAVANQVLHNKEAFRTNLKTDSQEAIANIIRVGTSAGGQRPKAVIAYNDATGEVRSGQTTAPEGFDFWLIKLDGVSNKELGDPMHFGEIEYVHYLLAKAAGINMTECRLYREHDRAHFMTRRFDRVNGHKLHMQTLCGIAHYDFNMLHAYSYEQAFGIMRRLRLTYPEAEEFYRRMVFNVVARNQDDHTKNTSFLMNRKGEWRLSPAYDMCWAYNPNGGWTATHQMSINNKWDHITREDLLTVASEMNVKGAKHIIDQVLDAVAQWPSLAKENSDIPQSTIDAIERTHVYL
ncbi:MAG: type II toxin-antitoxin system HipA family toxin [Paludibacteraceae bacterium]|nr:type II toxin-antitoxin system HipA family toxin [Paludibacteraceae bacterium]